MSLRVLIIDTSTLCCWLRVPTKETAGAADDLWDHARVNEILDRETALGATFVLPIATLVETGNHIAQAPNSRYEVAQALVAHLRATLDGDNPWATFTEQSDLWGEVSLRRLSDEWPVMAAQRMAMGDITIKFVADYYSEAGYDVEILTADANLKAYEPKRPAQVPRRRA